MIEAEWWDYDDAEEMAEAVAGDIGFIIESALDARGEALIAVPGGKTPLPIYAKLAQAKLNWKKVTIIPTDDRLVPLTDEKSNIRAIAQAFLPTGARVFPITSDIADYKLAGNSANAKLARNPGVIASFSRALTEGLSAQQDDAAYNQALDDAIESIYRASIT